MDINKLSEVLSKKLYKTKSFYIHGDIRKKIDSTVNIFDDLMVSFKGIEDYSKGQLLDISDATLKKVTYKKSDVSEYTTNLMKQVDNHTEIFQSTVDVKERFMFDLVKREIMEYDPMIFLNRKSKEEREEKIRNLRLAKLTFDAFNPDPLIEKEDSTLKTPIIYLNSYTPPAWQVKYPTPIKPEHLETLPKLFQEQIDFIIPCKKEQGILLSFMAHSLVKRHQSYLHLRGSRGNGKSILAKVIGSITGYCYTTRDGLLSDGFNADLKGKRITIFDDDAFVGTREGYLKLKALNNNSATYSEKYKQTVKTEKQFSSFIICSNSDDPFYSRHDERKMIVLNLSNENINTKLSEAKLNFLDSLLKVDEDDYTERELQFQAHIGHFLLNLYKKESLPSTYCYLGGQFWDDVLYSLGAFKKMAIEILMSGEKESYSYKEILYSFEDIKTPYQKTVRFSNLVKFLINDFRYQGEELVSKIDNKEQIIFVVDKYKPATVAFKDEGEFDL